MENKYSLSIELLNKAMGLEIATSLQYIYFHVHCADRGYTPLAKLFKRTSIAEMSHIEEFSERILFLDGEADINPTFKTVSVRKVEDMLKMAVDLEESTIDNYNTWAHQCGEALDSATKRLFEGIIAQEENHKDLFRMELDNLRAYGDKYLANQAAEQSETAASRVEVDASISE